MDPTQTLCALKTASTTALMPVGGNVITVWDQQNSTPIQQNTIFDPDGELGWAGPQDPNHKPPAAPTQHKFDPDGELGW